MIRRITAGERDEKLRAARQLLAARGELDAGGRWRRSIRSGAEARQRLAAVEAELAADRRQRLARLTTELAPAPAPPSPGWRHDLQGRVRLNCWEAGPVFATATRGHP
jgi:hypothetical protein